MAKLNLQSVVWKEGKYFVAQCLNVEVSSFGKTKKQALVNLDEALDLYFEDEKPARLIKIQHAEVVPTTVEYA
jgi:predicted RNase H-like HicB family nuclease